MVDYVGFFEGINNYCYDIFFRLRGSRRPSQEIVIIDVDDQSLEKLGRWPIARKNYAILLNKLHMARIVGFDLLFTEPTADDPIFLEAIQRYGKTVLATYVTKQHEVAKPAFSFTETALGHVHLDPGIDDIVRDVFLTISVGKQPLPSFASLIYYQLTSRPKTDKSPAHNTNQQNGFQEISQANRMGINFYGGNETFQHISLAEVILDNKWPASFFNNKIVLVGVTANGVADTVHIPFSEKGHGMSGAEVQANILNNLLDHSQIRKPGNLFRFFLVIAFSLAAIWLIGSIIRKRLALLFSCSFALLSLLAFVFFATFRVWLPPAPFIFIITAVFVCAHIYKLEYMGFLLNQADRDWHDSFNSIHDGIVIQDLDSRVVLTNQAAEQFSSGITEDILADRTQQLLQVKTIQDIQLMFDDTRNKYLELRSFRRYDVDGQCSGVVHVLRDVTEKKLMEQNQNKLQEQLIQAQKMEAIGTLAGGIAHDFNNILSPIIGYTELAMDSLPQGSDEHSMLSEVKDASMRAKELVKQILAFSRKNNQEKKILYLHPIINEALKLLRSSIPTSIEIRQSIDKNCGPVMCDPTQVHQIIMNLCTNAYHSMIKDGGILEVSMGSITLDIEETQIAGDLPSGKYIRLIISDTGYGMDKKTMDRIFEPYFTTKTLGEGTGLGLSVVLGIVENHNGRIKVYSEEGKGTTFTVYLPEIMTQDKVAETKEHKILPSGTEHILIVDDEASIAAIQARMLKKLGYQVTSVTDSIKALERFRDNPEKFDLVITDQTMPHISGSELAKRMLEIKPDIPIILCTGYSSLISKEKSRSLGIRHFLMKPVLMDELAKSVRSILDDPS